MNKSKIIIVDDHNLFREGLRFLLSQSKDIDVIADASNGLEFLNLLETKNPDLVLMDISMPVMDGIEATKKALEKYPHIRIIALSMFEDQEYYYKMIHAGVKGFLLKKTNAIELFDAINKVMSGQNYFSTDLLQSIILNMPKRESINRIATEKSIKFTKREHEVLNLLCTGLSSIEIAETLFLSKKTVEGHKYNLLSKTGSKNTVSLVMFAIKNKLIEI